MSGEIKQQQLLANHVERLLQCRRCPAMHKPVVSGGPVLSKILLVGQAPGDKEPVLGRPFAWTAGKTLFSWFQSACGMTEVQFRSSIYMAAVCRCFPGKKAAGGDRVPERDEIRLCSVWLEEELQILEPELVIPVGKVAIEQFIGASGLESIVGKAYCVKRGKFAFDLIPLPHPSGASPWHRMEPGKSLLQEAMQKIRNHPAMQRVLAHNKLISLSNESLQPCLPSSD